LTASIGEGESTSLHTPAKQFDYHKVWMAGPVSQQLITAGGAEEGEDDWFLPGADEADWTHRDLCEQQR